MHVIVGNCYTNAYHVIIAIPGTVRYMEHTAGIWNILHLVPILRQGKQVGIVTAIFSIQKKCTLFHKALCCI